MTTAPMTAGLTVDGVPVPPEIEGAGGDAVAAYVAERHPDALPEPESAPPTTDEGAE